MTAAPISSLDELPLHAVRTRGDFSSGVLAQLAAASGHRFVYADLAECSDRTAVFRAIGAAFQLPEWFGANLDALYDNLRDLIATSEAPGFVIVLAALRRTRALDKQQRAALLDVLRDAAELAVDRRLAWRVFYD